MAPQAFYPLAFARFKEVRQQAHPRCVRAAELLNGGGKPAGK
jgi:hypothetical protein